MGKRYANELQDLPETYAWANQASVDALVKIVERLRQFPLLAIGSGGSLSAAAFCAYLHEQVTGAMARSATPLDSVMSRIHGPSHAALVLTAGGGNPDVLGAVEHLSARGLAVFAALCTRPKSALARLVQDHPSLSLVEYELPCGKDGFLATNSLLAMSMLLFRAYGQKWESPELPDDLSGLIGASDIDSFHHLMIDRSESLWSRRSFIVLCSPCTQPAAMDLESKFTEAALANVQWADYRNFAHGRHHWIAKELHSTGVIAFVTDAVRTVAETTLKVLPKSVPSLVIDVGGEDGRGAVAALVNGLHLVGAAGVARGVDPGRPHVPPFGRKIYHLKAFNRLAVSNGIPSREKLAISRKAQQPLEELKRTGDLDAWRSYYGEFMKKLSGRSIRGLVLDYDGTLCEPTERFGAPDEKLLKRLAQFARSGIAIGVVTGRGKSVRESLRQALPRALWPKILVGYYNGGVVRPLNSNEKLSGIICSDGSLDNLATVLNADARIAMLCEMDCRAYQITFQPRSEAFRRELWETLQQCIARFPGIRLVESSHSIDAIAPGVSKLSLVKALCDKAGIEDAGDVLCIGDCGRWPGNDFELLSEPSSLSVWAVSAAPDSCWNIAQPENQFTSATREYLVDLFSVQKGRLRLKRQIIE